MAKKISNLLSNLKPWNLHSNFFYSAHDDPADTPKSPVHKLNQIFTEHSVGVYTRHRFYQVMLGAYSIFLSGAVFEMLHQTL